jgi:hypothetical protein
LSVGRRQRGYLVARTGTQISAGLRLSGSDRLLHAAGVDERANGTVDSQDSRCG